MIRTTPRTLNIDQAIAYAGVSRRTVYYWIKHGLVLAERTDWGLRVDLASLQWFLSKKRGGARVGEGAAS